jgi:hypothetical protein
VLTSLAKSSQRDARRVRDDPTDLVRTKELEERLALLMCVS